MKTQLLAAIVAATFSITACSKEAPKPAPAKAAETQKVIKTKEDVKAFQKANGLKADGVAGPKTQDLMKQKGYKYEPAAPAKKAAKPAKKDLNLKTPPGKAIK